MSLSCHRQYLKVSSISLWFLALLLILCWRAPECSAQQIRVVPSISVVEQYDTNVFFTPKSQLPAGTKPEDLISVFTPQLNFMQGNALVKTNLSVGAVIQKFVHNSDLDNVGFNGSAGIDLGQAINRILPRNRAFRVFGTYQYSPSAPAFGATALGGGGGFGYGGVGISGPTDSGLLTQRVKTTMYSLGVADSYSLSPTTDFQTMYTYSSLSFGETLAPAATTSGQVTNFDTATHTISAGPTSKMSAVDTLGVKYTFTQTSQPQFGDYAMHNGTLAWGRSWAREWSSTLNGGLALIEPIPTTSTVGGQAVGGQGKIPATIAPTGGFSVTYASGSSFLRKLGSEIREATRTDGPSATGGGGFLPLLGGMNMPGSIATPGSYQVTLLYNVGVYPSFVQNAGPLYTHIVSFGGTAGISDKVTAQALFNYARSSYTSDAIGTTFTTYGTTVSFSYLITPTFTARLSHQWLNFDNLTTGVSGGDLGFSKQMVLLGFTYAYAPRGDFFRSGAFWESPSGGSSSDTGQTGSGGVEIKK